MRKLRTAAAAAAVSAAALGAGALAANASTYHHPVHPVVSISDEHGVLTTGSHVYAGEVLAGFGYPAVAGQVFVIASVTDMKNGTYRVTVPGLPATGSSVFDFRVAH